MKSIWFARILFVLIATYCGYRIGVQRRLGYSVEFSIMAFISAIFVVIFEYSTNIISSKKILLAALGCFFGLAMAWLLAPTIPTSLISESEARIICNILLGYFGIVLAIKHSDRFTLKNLKFFISSPTENAVILDTNIIIDGRIVDLVSTRFLKSNLIVPEFILSELQIVSDSSDANKRSRGRRGLDNLEVLKEKAQQQLQIVERDYPEIRDVDHKLIQLARELNYEILTNDYNLGKVASLHQVKVMYLNDLVQALKPPVFVGEPLSVLILREGKENHQGVGYLDDGTMVVIDDASRDISKEVKVAVTSILQTSAGRMIFARKLAPNEMLKNGEIVPASQSNKIENSEHHENYFNDKKKSFPGFQPRRRK